MKHITSELTVDDYIFKLFETTDEIDIFRNFTTDNPYEEDVDTEVTCTDGIVIHHHFRCFDCYYKRNGEDSWCFAYLDENYDGFDDDEEDGEYEE